MADKRHLHLVAYDIRDPKRWRRAYKLLRGYGERIQYSVFRVAATPLQAARLRWELEGILDPEDALMMIRMCPSCASRVRATHDEEQWPEDCAIVKIVG
jgi:CRISPR-associated protein Cas2